MITFEALDFDLTEDHDITFFGSPRAVLFFRFKYDLKRAGLIACSGSKTQELLESFGYPPEFVADQSKGVNAASNEFAAWVENRKVFFPTSSKSLMSFALNLDKDHWQRADCYSTNITPKKVEDADIYVFTSPSNVAGFLEANKVTKDAQIISWGSSTSKALSDKEIQFTELPEPSMDALLDLLK